MIDDALRRFRGYLPDPGSGETAARALARRVMAHSGAAPAPRARRIPRRGVAVAAVTGIATVGALAVVAVKMDPRSGAAATIVIGEPRVDWGMRALVTVTPDPGVSVEDATRRAKELIAERLERMDVQGAEVGSPEPGQVSLKVPGASDRWQFMPLGEIPHVQVFSRDQIIASGRTLAELEKQIGTPAAGAPVHHLVQFGEPAGGSLSAIITVRSQRDVDRLIRQTTSQDHSVLAIDATWQHSMTTGRGAKHVIVRGRPTVPTSELALSIENDTPVLSFPSRYDDAATGAVMVTQGGVVPREWRTSMLMFTPAGTTTSPDGSMTVLGLGDASATINPLTGAVIPLSGQVISSSRSLTGDLTFSSFAHYGQPPVHRGTTVDAPALISQMIGARTGTTWQRVLTGRQDDTSVGVYAWTTPKGHRGAGFEISRRGDAAGAGSLGYAGSGTSEPCAPGLGAPAITTCTNSPFVSSGTPGQGQAKTLLSAGRIGPDVTRIEARLSNGRVLPGITAESWYVVIHSGAISPAVTREGFTLTAYGTDGRKIDDLTVRPLR